VKKPLVAVLAVATALSVAAPATAAPWVRKAAVDGAYSGRYRRTECTYTRCPDRTAAFRIGWVFTPVAGGIRLRAPATGWRMFLRWVPGEGTYVGTNAADANRTRRVWFRVTRQTLIEGVWTARELRGTMRTWWTTMPRFHDQGRVLLRRRAPQPATG
jgi:hypothetical protein